MTADSNAAEIQTRHLRHSCQKCYRLSKRILWESGIDGKAISKWITKEQDVRVTTGYIRLRVGSMLLWIWEDPNGSLGLIKARHLVTNWATVSFYMMTAALHKWRPQPRINPWAVPGRRENSAVLTSRDDGKSREAYLNAGFTWY
jgi:hypothetical protein